MVPHPHLPRHPRRFGFAIWNTIAAVLFAAGLYAYFAPRDPSIGEVPNVMLIYAGLIVLGVVWIASWVAWGLMVLSRHRANHTP